MATSSGDTQHQAELAAAVRAGYTNVERAIAEIEFERLVALERIRQDQKWGVQTHLGHAWCGILLEEVGEFARAVNEANFQEAETELVQIAAVCRAAYAQSKATLALDPQWGEFGHAPAVSNE